MLWNNLSYEAKTARSLSDFKHKLASFYYQCFKCTPKDTLTAKNSGVSWFKTLLVRPKFLIYTSERDEEHHGLFHMLVSPRDCEECNILTSVKVPVLFLMLLFLPRASPLKNFLFALFVNLGNQLVTQRYQVSWSFSSSILRSRSIQRHAVLHGDVARFNSHIICWPCKFTTKR